MLVELPPFSFLFGGRGGGEEGGVCLFASNLLGLILGSILIKRSYFESDLIS